MKWVRELIVNYSVCMKKKKFVYGSCDGLYLLLAFCMFCAILGFVCLCQENFVFSFFLGYFVLVFTSLVASNSGNTGHQNDVVLSRMVQLVHFLTAQ